MKIPAPQGKERAKGVRAVRCARVTRGKGGGDETLFLWQNRQKRRMLLIVHNESDISTAKLGIAYES